MMEETDVLVVGAGLAGLACALGCAAHGLDVTVVEASDRVGGRVATDIVDGYRVDRGFQVINTSYREAARILDLGALSLREFTPGAALFRDGRLHPVINPVRRPRQWRTALAAPVGRWPDKVAFGLAAGLAAAAPEGAVRTALRATARRDVAVAELVHRLHLDPVGSSFLRPFLSGVLLDGDLSATSARFAALLVRGFARGRIAVPARGMGAIPAQLAARLPAGALRLATRVTSLGAGPGNSGRAGTWRAALEGGGTVDARAIVVATDPVTAGRLVPGSGVAPGSMRSVTTFWHRAPAPPLGAPLLVLDGEERLVANSVVVSNASPDYLPEMGRDRAGALVATSVLGRRGDGATERAVRDRLAVLYGVPTDGWEVVAAHQIDDALPPLPPGRPLRRAVRFGPGRYVCGDHRDTPSIEGALMSGRRAAAAVVDDLGVRDLPIPPEPAGSHATGVPVRTNASVNRSTPRPSTREDGA